MTDTALKRASAINVASPWRGALPLPDGAVGQGDRQTAAFMYSGISAGEAAAGGDDLPALAYLRRRLD